MNYFTQAKTKGRAFFMSKKVQAVVTIATVSAMASSSAHAAFTMPAYITAGFADMLEAGEGILALMWPVLVPLAIGWFLVRMFKKGSTKVG